MPIPNIFDSKVVDENIARLEKLKADTQPQWGKMDAAQMMAHVNVSYDILHGKVDPKVGGFMKIMLKLFVKNTVVGEKPYKKNSRTAPYFLIADEREFASEKQKLIDNMRWVQENGAAYFEGRENKAFGKLSSKEWNNMFSKHIDHHFRQFGI